MVDTKGYNLTFVDVERSGDPVAAQTGVGKMDVDPVMQARVPDWIMDWYRHARAHAVTLDELEA